MTSPAETWLTAWQSRSELPSVPEMAAELLRLSDLLDRALGYQRRVAEEYVEAEAAYRRAKAAATLQARAALEEDGIERPTVAEKEAWVYAREGLVDLRAKAQLHDAMRWAAKEAVTSRMAQISALQTLLNAVREEISFARSGPPDQDRVAAS